MTRQYHYYVAYSERPAKDSRNTRERLVAPHESLGLRVKAGTVTIREVLRVTTLYLNRTWSAKLPQAKERETFIPSC